MTNTKRIVFIHPDMGIGGAERLIVDTAIATLQNGYDTKIYTAFWDRNRCFQETKDGTIPIVRPFTFVPRTILGKFQAICANLRCLILTCWMLFYESPHVVVVDAVSSPLILLKLFGIPSLFYCHFPDQLLAIRENRSLFYSFYRYLMDWIEEHTLLFADTIVVNSQFTATIFQETFPAIAKKHQLSVLYPYIAIPSEESVQSDDKITILSINRFERKKHVELLIQALAYIRDNQLVSQEKWNAIFLVIVGGYDSRLVENVTCLLEWQHLAEVLGLSHCTHFLTNATDKERQTLLGRCRMVVYTPMNEHFGIVPLEAMAMKKPVIACNTGGPRETIVHGETGFLCEDAPKDFAIAIAKLIDDEALAVKMGERGLQRVKETFSKKHFADQLGNILNQLGTNNGRKKQ
eukprot:jgi/Galph1/1915/GphlegSOOS_G596.1